MIDAPPPPPPDVSETETTKSLFWVQKSGVPVDLLILIDCPSVSSPSNLEFIRKLLVKTVGATVNVAVGYAVEREIKTIGGKAKSLAVAELDQRISQLAPRCIVTMGQKAKELTTGVVGGITACRGVMFRRPDGIPVIPAFHPSFVLMNLTGANGREPNTESARLFASDLGKAGRLLDAGASSIERILVNDEQAFSLMVKDIETALDSGKSPYLAVDTETTGLYPFYEDGDILLISLAVSGSRGYSIPVAHPESQWNDRLSISRVQGKISQWLEKYPLVGHNFKFDFMWLLCHFGVLARNLVIDTMNGNHMLYAGSRPSNLEAVASEFADMDNHKSELKGYQQKLLADRYSELKKGRVDGVALTELKKQAKDFSMQFRNVPLSVLYPYAADDAVATWASAGPMIKQLKKRDQWLAYQRLYSDTHPAFALMEYSGVKIDMPVFNGLYRSLPDEIAAIEHASLISGFSDKFKLKFGCEFKMASPADRAKMVFDILGVPESLIVKSKNQKGDRSFAKETQKRVFEWAETANLEPDRAAFLKLIVEHVKTSFLYAQHSKNLVEFIAPQGPTPPGPLAALKRLPDEFTVHPNIQLVTVTGRASAKNPPIHGLPKNSKVRRQYISRYAEHGGLVGSFDYSQMELRVLAALSGDESLRSAFESGEDIHKFIAATCLGCSIREITGSVRQKFKSVTFGLVYQMSDESLARVLRISEQEALGIRQIIFKKFSAIESFINRQMEYAVKNGEIRSCMGRIRPLSRKTMNDGAIRRCAVNTPIQGPASDNCYLAMVACYQAMERRGLRGRPMFFAHDAVVFDIAPHELHQTLVIAREEMELNVGRRIPEFAGVPFKAEYDVGVNLRDLVRLDQVSDIGVDLVFESQEDYDELFPRLAQRLESQLSGFLPLESIETESERFFRTTGFWV